MLNFGAGDFFRDILLLLCPQHSALHHIQAAFDEGVLKLICLIFYKILEAFGIHFFKSMLIAHFHLLIRPDPLFCYLIKHHPTLDIIHPRDIGGSLKTNNRSNLMVSY